MNKRYLRRGSIPILLAMILTISGILVNPKTMYAKGIGGAMDDGFGNTMEYWTPEEGYVVNPEYADELADWRENFDGSDEQYYAVNGHKPTYTQPRFKDGGTIASHQGQPYPPGGEMFANPWDPVVEIYYNAYIASERGVEKVWEEAGDLAEYRPWYYTYENYMNGKCSHDFVLKERSIEPTCGEYGEDTYECSKCGIPKKEDVEPLEHSFEVVEDVKATCTEDGRKISVCQNCGEEKKEKSTKAVGHKKSASEIPATWFKDGLSVTTCSVCGEELSRTILPKKFKWDFWNK